MAFAQRDNAALQQSPAARAAQAAGGAQADDLRVASDSLHELVDSATYGPRAQAQGAFDGRIQGSGRAQLQRQQIGGLFGAGAAVVQRLSEDEFIDATTSSILWCIKWRNGNDDDLARMQRALQSYDDIDKKQVVKKVQALDDLVQVAQGIKADGKLKAALWKIIAEAREIAEGLRDQPAFIEHDEKRKADEAAEVKRREMGKAWGASTPEERSQRIATYAGPGAAYLAGVLGTMTEELAVRQLYANFARRTDFNYTFNSAGFFSGSGDCSVLTGEFRQLALQGLGIDTAAGGNGGAPVYVPAGRIVHSAAETGNVDQAHWFFSTGHVWVVWSGQPLDVLFSPSAAFGALQASTPAAQTGDAPLAYTAGDVTLYKKHPDWSSGGNYDRYTLNRDQALGKAK